MPAAERSYPVTKMFRLEPNRPKRLRALAAKARARLPNDPKARKLARNLEAAARLIERRMN